MKKHYQDPDSCLDSLFTDESLFTTSSGIIGLRGNLAEGVDMNTISHPGCYMNGIYSTYNYQYGEKGFGYPDVGQTIINLPNPTGISFNLNGEKINSEHAVILECNRFFDTITGISNRETRYKTHTGFDFKILERRVISKECPFLIIIEYSIQSFSYNGDIELVSTLDANTKNYSDSSDPRVLDSTETLFDIINIDKSHLHIKTINTEQNVFMSFKHNEIMDYKVKKNILTAYKKIHLSPGETYATTKYIVITSDIYQTSPDEENSNLLEQFSKNSIDDLAHKRVSPLQISGTDELNEIVQYNLMQLEQSCGNSEFHSIAAKGLSGEGYEGHYFWDTEMYLFPYFLLTNQSKAKNILMYRVHTLQQAKEEAIKLGHSKGAKYPWVTINGEEASPYYPAGTAQYHINSIISYQIIQYHFISKDIAFLMKYGFDILYETALIYLEIGHFNNGIFEIHNITGPDEYTTIVNNNYYTNSMAKYHMEHTVKFYELYKHELHKKYDNEMIDAFKKASANMLILFDEKLKINPQDDTFLSKRKKDMSEWKKPLLLNYHPLTIYRHQVCKQADAILAHMLLNNIDTNVMKNTVNYYDSVTTHDSSLSKCIFSIMHTYVGQTEIGEKYFNEQLYIDINNTLGNTGNGLHLANMGGTYLIMMYGFLGVRFFEDHISIQPWLPKSMNSYQTVFRYQGATITIDVCQTKITILTSEETLFDVYGLSYIIKDKTIIKRH